MSRGDQFQPSKRFSFTKDGLNIVDAEEDNQQGQLAINIAMKEAEQGKIITTERDPVYAREDDGSLTYCHTITTAVFDKKHKQVARIEAEPLNDLDFTESELQQGLEEDEAGTIQSKDDVKGYLIWLGRGKRHRLSVIVETLDTNTVRKIHQAIAQKLVDETPTTKELLAFIRETYPEIYKVGIVLDRLR